MLNTKTKKYIMVLAIIFIAVLAIRIWKGFLPIPLWIRHIFNTSAYHEKLYNPILVEDFNFAEEGYSELFVIAPEYLDFYGIGILSEKKLPQDFLYHGILKAEFFHKGKKLFEKEVVHTENAWTADVNMDDGTFGRIIYCRFEIPLGGKYLKDISVKMTVIKADEYLRNKGCKLFIAVDPYM